MTVESLAILDLIQNKPGSYTLTIPCPWSPPSHSRLTSSLTVLPTQPLTNSLVTHCVNRIVLWCIVWLCCSDLILFGTGSRIRPLPPSVSLYLQQLGIGYEVLQSNKALATFNMLVEEERLVMAALVPYGEEAGAKVEQTTEDNRPSAALRRRIEEQLAQETS